MYVAEYKMHPARALEEFKGDPREWPSGIYHNGSAFPAGGQKVVVMVVDGVAIVIDTYELQRVVDDENGIGTIEFYRFEPGEGFMVVQEQAEEV